MAKLRSRFPLVPDVRHQDRGFGAAERLGDVRARRVQRGQGLPLPVHPHRLVDLTPESGLLLHGHAHTPLGDDLAGSVRRVVLERPVVPGAVHLRGEQVPAGGGTCVAQVHVGLLSALQGVPDARDQSVVEERFELWV